MNHRSILSAFGVISLVACSASSGGTGGSGVSAGSGNSGNAAAGSANTGNTGNNGTGGSGTSINTGNDNQPDSGDVMNGVCSNQSFDLDRKPAEVLILLDRSASMEEDSSGKKGGTPTKWSFVVPGLKDTVNATDTVVSWGFKTFPEGSGSECVAGSVTDAIPVPIAPANAMAVTAQIDKTTDAGNGTPTGDAIKAAVTYLKTLTDSNQKFILLATDGDPSCAGTTKDSATARTFAVQAVTDAATAGFKTIVLGIATTKDSSTQTLNDLAVAGQMPVPTATGPLDKKFYVASDSGQLAMVLGQITGAVASCTFDLTAKPPDPYNIAVHVNDQKAPNDMTKTNGWDYTGSDQKQIQIYGSWCDQVKAANAKTVNFVFGCPGQPPPA